MPNFYNYMKILLNDRKFNAILNTYVCSAHKNQDNILTGDVTSN